MHCTLVLPSAIAGVLVLLPDSVFEAHCTCMALHSVWFQPHRWHTLLLTEQHFLCSLNIAGTSVLSATLCIQVVVAAWQLWSGALLDAIMTRTLLPGGVALLYHEIPHLGIFC